MWPHFFKCGSAARPLCICYPYSLASMWPHFFKCGSDNWNGQTYSWIRMLQCGRTFSSAEVRLKCAVSMLGMVCFNVAALFQVRKLGRAAIPVFNSGKLQCGRTFSSAEVKSARKKRGGHTNRFNVAALFQVRKSSASVPPEELALSFNVAALFQVRKSLQMI